MIDQSFAEPNQMLETAKIFDFIVHTTNKKILRNLFGDIKESYTSDMIEIDKIREMLENYDKANKDIEVKLKN